MLVRIGAPCLICVQRSMKTSAVTGGSANHAVFVFRRRSMEVEFVFTCQMIISMCSSNRFGFPTTVRLYLIMVTTGGTLFSDKPTSPSASKC